ncbi:MAG: Omp28-related outer membrane protein [Bacteroidetes bacterium]|jgi:hypothetical protein|nr:Omp28-related outer membrane protein [Bacteroidota bacterium]
MKRFFFLFFVLIVAFYGCDKNDCPYEDKNLCDPAYVDSLNNVVDTGSTDTSISDTGMVVAPGVIRYSATVFQEYESKALIEDFTGYRCLNCLDAIVTGDNLLDQYGDQLIVIGVHSTSQFAAPTNDGPEECFNLDFRTPESNTYLGDFGVSGLPTGAVNRRDFGQGLVYQSSAWNAHVNTILQESPSGFIRFRNIELEAANDQIDFEIAVKNLSTIPESGYNLTIGIYENGIVECQKDGSETINPFTHNHVFRGNINGIYGEPVLDNGQELGENEAQLLEHSFSLNPEWDYSNCYLFAYLHDSQTREIIQVEEVSFPQ